MRDLVLLSLPDWVDANPIMYFPLSLMYLGAVTRDAGYDVEIVDCRGGIKRLPEARFYGFSCATPQINLAKKWSGQLPGKTIIGGAHPSLLPNDCTKHFDYVVRGEGENVILEILEGNLPNGVVASERIRDLDSLPYPAWDMVKDPFSDTLFPGERYGTGQLAATLIGSRGCPYSCSFCGNIFTQPVIFRSAEDIVGEVEQLTLQGIRHFRFEDDCFTIHPELGWLCAELRRLQVHYKCHTRSNLITPEKADRLKYSGCEECGLGVESADDRVLEINNKGVTSKEHLEAVKTIKESGLRAKAYFVTGLPGERDETIALNKLFVQEAQLDKWTISTFMPYPGCPVYRSPGKFGVEITNKDFSKWWNYADGSYNHILIGQTPEEMWARYVDFYAYMSSGEWIEKR